jgi:hypothetical protein
MYVCAIEAAEFRLILQSHIIGRLARHAESLLMMSILIPNLNDNHETPFGTEALAISAELLRNNSLEQ